MLIIISTELFVYEPKSIEIKFESEPPVVDVDSSADIGESVQP